MELATIAGNSSRKLDVVMSNGIELYIVTLTSNASLRGIPFPEPPGSYNLMIQIGSNEQSFSPSKINLRISLDQKGNLDVKEI